MKQFLLLLSLILTFAFSVKSQVNVFSENFEGTSLSMTSSSMTGLNNWAISTSLHAGGLKSDSARVAASDTTYLTSSAFSTTGSYVVNLQFKQICKIHWLDAAIVEVSNDNGATWTRLNGMYYQGLAQFGNIGNRFTAVSYAVDWNASVDAAVPTNTWWKTEQFNISSLVSNSAQVKVRFGLIDGDGMGANFNYGWLLDDIIVSVPSQFEATAMSYNLPYALTSGCGLSNETVQIKILNSGAGIINGNLTASFQRDGSAAVTETVSQSINPTDSLLYTFNTAINLYSSVDTLYPIKVWVSLVGDPNQTNDTIIDTLASRVPLSPPVITDPTIPFNTSVTLHAIHTDTLFWYSDPLAQNQLSMGQYFTTPVLLDTTIFYVQASGAMPDVKITEIVQYETGMGATNPYPAWITGVASGDFDGVEITNLGNAPANLSGWTLNFYSTATSNGTNGAFTFPIGTILPSGGISVIDIKNTSAVNNPANFYFGAGLTSANPQSSTVQAYYIKDLGGNVIDAVSANGQVFDALATGVTAADWVGVVPSSSGKAGISRLTSDSDSASDWGIASINPIMQSFGTLNPGLTIGQGSSGVGTACPSIAKPVKVMISGMPIYNAGVTSITSPSGAYTQGSIVPVTVNLKNFSGDTLKKVNISYSVNGVLKNTFAWTGNLLYNQTTSVTIGTDTFSGGAYSYKAWTWLPNDSADQYTSNDTATGIAYVCLSGTFTLGGSSADFSDFAVFNSIISNVGVCGPTVINILPGTYNVQLNYGLINGSSNINQLTFQSSTGINTDVVLQYAAASTADNFVVKLTGTQYVNFKNLTIEASGTTYGYALLLLNGASNNSFEGNIIRSITTVSSSSNPVRLYGGGTHYNSFKNNIISGGFYGIYAYGSSSTAKINGNQFINNDISGFYYYATYLFYHDSLQFLNNSVHDGINTTQYGINANYCDNYSNLSNNKVVLFPSSYAYAMRVAYSNYTNPALGRVIVSNNMISIGSGTITNYGLYVFYSSNTHVLYNSIHIESGGGSSRALYQNGTTTVTGQIFKNNIFSSKDGFAAYFNTPASISYCDYNDYYCTTATLAYHGGNIATLAALQLASGKDSNSVALDPLYTSISDLHASALGINAAGSPDSLVSIDYDGFPRDVTTPDIGADEFIMWNDDAGVLALVSPVIACPASSSSIEVKVRNFGIDTLFTATVNWKVNGIAQTSYILSDTLLPGQTANVVLGNYVFQDSINYVLNFWTTNPNGVVDLNNPNDSLNFPFFKAALAGGTYTIGSNASNDFPNFATAIDYLTNYGICGSVVFNVDSGTYNGNLLISNILGTDANNTITFQSTTSDSTDVKIVSSSASTISFIGASYINFKNISVINSSASQAVAIKNGTHHLAFNNCVIRVPLSTSSAVAPIYNYTGIDYNLTFTNNAIIGGYYGVYNYGGSSTSLESSNVFSNNIISDFYLSGLYNYYQDSIIINGNRISNSAASATNYGIYAYYCDDAIEVSNNVIKLNGAGTQYGVYLYYCDASVGSHAVVANNMVSIINNSTKYGIYSAYGTNHDYFYNSINISGTGASYAMYFNGYAGHSIKNNNLINGGTGTGTRYALYLNSAYPPASDYNNIYCANGNAAFWVSAKATLADYQTASSLDAHSVSLPVVFFAPNNLHTVSSTVNGYGTPVYITHDIDGDLRNTLTPDIGADEFDPPAQEAALIEVFEPTTSCGMDTVEVKIKIANFGLDTISGNLTANYSILGNANVVTENISTMILPGDTLDYTFIGKAIISSPIDSTFYLNSWISLTGDPIQLNDTILKVFNNNTIPSAPVISSSTTTYGNTALISATAIGTILWFATDTSMSPVGLGTSYTTPVLFDTTQFVAKVLSTNGCYSDYSYTNVIVTGIPTGEVGIAEILVNSGCGLDTNESVTIRVFNNGTQTVNTNLTARYKINANAYTSFETINIPVPSQDTIDYVFINKADLYAYNADTVFKIKAEVLLTGDPYHTNDTLTLSGIESNLTAVDPIVVSPQSLAYGASVTLTATSLDTLIWYGTDTSTVEDYVGHYYTTPYLYADTTFYVEAVLGASYGAAGTNIAPLATASASNCSTGPCGALNDLNLGVCGTQLMWISTASPPSSVPHTNYIDFEWTAPQSISGMKIHHAQTTTRLLSGGELYYWNGSAWVYFYTFTNLPMQCENMVMFPLVTTTKFRITTFQTSGTQLSNPNFREIEVFAAATGCASNRIPIQINVASPPAVDAGIYSIDSPSLSSPSGVNTPIQVKLKNFGTSTLTSASIIYFLDNVPKDTFAWTGSLAFNQVSSPITISSDVFVGGLHTIMAKVINPNGIVSGVNPNDSMILAFSACMNGNYTVGGASADFVDIYTAISAVQTAGVCGHVVFLLIPDTINGQLIIPAIAGLDSNNTVTFQSATGDSTDFVIQYAATGTADNYVVRFAASKYITLRKVTIKALGATYAYGVELTGGASYNTVENCYIYSAVSTSSYGRPLVITGGTNNKFNTISNNIIDGGYYGIYLSGSSSSALDKGNKILNNDIKNFYYYGLYLYYQDSVQAIGNYIHDGTNLYQYGMYTYYIFNGFDISKNIIDLNPASYAYAMRIYFANYYSITTNPRNVGKVYNNMISINSGTGINYGLYDYYCDKVEYYFNTVNISSGDLSSRALYQYNTSSNTIGQTHINNIYSNTSGGYAAYYGTPVSVNNADYNNYFVTGTKLAYWNGDKVDLSALQTASGYDTHSKSVDPTYYSNTNLHSNALLLDGAGFSISGITEDIDGHLRSTTPDIGADEFTTSPNDAGVFGISSSTTPALSGTHPLKVKIKNYGTDTLQTVNVNFSLNGVLNTTPLTWNGSLLPGDTVLNLNVANGSFITGNNLVKAWTSMPNGVIDGQTMNDTLHTSIYGCSNFLHGTYTVGGATADYPTISSAVDALNICGIDSAVVFLINPGNYNEQFELTAISGADSLNTVTFTSSLYDSTSVNINYSPGGLKPYVVSLNGTDYVHFKNLSIEVTNNAYTILIKGGASHNVFESNILRTPITTSSTAAVIYSSTDNDNYNTFRYNSIENGYYAVYWRGSSTTSLESKNIFEYNNITGYYYYGLYLYYQDAPTVVGNYVADGAANYGYGLYMYYCDNNVLVSNNILDLTPASVHYGLYMNSCDGSSSLPGRVFNNSISISSGSGASYGMYIYNNSYVEFAHNSINVSAGSATSRAVYVTSGSNLSFLNNNLVSVAYNYYVSTASAVVTSDYNNFYGSSASVFAYWGSAVADLTALQSASGKDMHSISTDPMFYAPSDLHVISPVLNAAATPISYVTSDIDGQVRNATTPDIGAYEFTPTQWDVYATSLVRPINTFGPAINNTVVEFTFRNIGLDTVTSVTVSYRYNGLTTTQNWGGMLAPGADTSYTFPGGFTAIAGTKPLLVYVNLVNDANAANDTIFATYTGVPFLSPSYVDNFDVQPFIWAQEGNVWEHGTPAGSVITVPHSAPNVWMTELSSNYPSSTNSYLYSPYFNFAIDTAMTMSFWQYRNLLSNDGVNIEYTKDNGVSWVSLGFLNDPASPTNWYNTSANGIDMFSGTSSGWEFQSYHLDAFNYEPMPVQFRFHLVSDGSGTADGYALDDFKITLPLIQHDAGVTSIELPQATTPIGAGVTVKVKVKNYGYDPLTLIPIQYDVNNSGNPVSENIVLTGSGLLPDSTYEFIFATSFISPVSSYSLCVRTLVSGDLYSNNDGQCATFGTTPGALDAAIDHVNPKNVVSFGHPNTVTAWIFNRGTTPLSSVDVKYSLNHLNDVVQNWTGTALNYGDSAMITFTQPFNAPLGNFILCVEALLPNDVNTANDESCEALISSGLSEITEQGFKLFQNVPNPANSQTQIAFEIPQSGAVSVEIADVAGRVLMTNESNFTAGHHVLEMDLKNFANGVYYYTLVFDHQKLTRKMIIAK